MAAKKAGVKRFVPSDFTLDMFKVKDEIIGNVLRRRFSEEILHPSGVGYTNMLTGVLLENGTINFIGILDRANKQVNFKFFALDAILKILIGPDMGHRK